MTEPWAAAPKVGARPAAPMDATDIAFRPLRKGNAFVTVQVGPAV